MHKIPEDAVPIYQMLEIFYMITQLCKWINTYIMMTSANVVPSLFHTVVQLIPPVGGVVISLCPH